MKKAIFLDRDGVINDNKKPVNKPKDLIFYPWTIEALKILSKADFMLFIVTNQGGIEMGYFTENDLKAIHDEMMRIFRLENIVIDDIAYCPHFKTKCECRKPSPGMLLSLAKNHHIDLNASYMIGDREMDITAGFEAGCTTIKIGKPCNHAHHTVDNLLEAANLIMDL
ncbi:D-glycero-alpha-D-manno-heptose-1,7-bisphosphate 7-phosphatase [Crassaminicella profunda]|uniref:D-glycero-alpha-D-manno-heptose-1,7-bisphosphate 7-phosphatase n=1 Tax=Crassaminicella profunda TaxID=1286698 RepID=UPI001CA75A71|nr:HAD family hydrolase [Crassaminicella profunda]QZY53832.1 HAD family hydrolase [Crassaminicella profunda]